MALDIQGMTDAMQSHAMELGIFERTNAHEPKAAPGNGLSWALWAQSVAPARGSSGLASTTAVLLFRVRLYQPMVSEPQDGIDPAVLGAVDLLINTYSGDFDLGGLVRNVDLLGQYGTPLGARAGYVTIGNTPYRIMDIDVPLVVNDVWSQVP